MMRLFSRLFFAIAGAALVTAVPYENAFAAASNWSPALVSALVHEPGDDIVETCAETAHLTNDAYVKANFSVRRVALRGGPTMLVAEGGGACVCGSNCKIEVFRNVGERYVSVLSTYALDADVRPDGTVVANAHDSAAVTDRTTYRWNGSRYVDIADEIVYGENVVKPAQRVVRFAPGASSALLRGDKLAAGYDDRFAFAGAAGQVVTLALVRHDAHFEGFDVQGPGGASLGSDKAGMLRLTLPRTATYTLDVRGADDSFSTYTLRIAIR
jgi:hypothetical protein